MNASLIGTRIVAHHKLDKGGGRANAHNDGAIVCVVQCLLSQCARGLVVVPELAQLPVLGEQAHVCLLGLVKVALGLALQGREPLGLGLLLGHHLLQDFAGLLRELDFVVAFTVAGHGQLNVQSV